MKALLLVPLLFLIGCASTGGPRDPIDFPEFPRIPSKQALVRETIIVKSPRDIDLDVLYVAGPELGGLNPDDRTAKPIFSIVTDGLRIGTPSRPLTYKGGDGVHLYANKCTLWLHGLGGEDAISTPRYSWAENNLKKSILEWNTISGYFQNYQDKTIQLNSGLNNRVTKVWDKNRSGKTLKLDGKKEKLPIEVQMFDVISSTTIGNADGPRTVIEEWRNRSAKTSRFSTQNGGTIRHRDG